MVSEKAIEMHRVFIQWGYVANLYPFFMESPSLELVMDGKKWKWIRRPLFVAVVFSYFSASYFLIHGLLNDVSMPSVMLSVGLADIICLGAEVQRLFLSNMPSFLTLWNSLIRLNQIQGQS